jgi:hypothetical protein
MRRQRPHPTAIRPLRHDPSGLRTTKTGGSLSNSGGAGINTALAKRRAELVKAILLAAHLPADRIDAVGVSTTRPLAKGSQPEARARNRRVELGLFRATRLTAALPGTAVALAPFTATFGKTAKTVSTQPVLALRIAGADVSTEVRTPPAAPATIGLLQFLTSEARSGVYRTRHGHAAVLDYGHCVNQFAPCRDVDQSADAFTSPPGTLHVVDNPGIGLPRSVRHPAHGDMRLVQAILLMDFVIVAAVRSADQLQPVQFLAWQVDAQLGITDRLLGDATDGEIVGSPLVAETKRGSGSPPGLDMVTALSSPTCKLRTRSIDLSGREGVCLPAFV